MTILIVEDDAQCREMMSAALEDLGIEVLTADGPENSLPLLCLPSVDGVICDGLEGQWVEVHAEAVRHGKRFVLFSGDGLQLSKANWMGIRAYMKPQPIREILCGLAFTDGGETCQTK